MAQTATLSLSSQLYPVLKQEIPEENHQEYIASPGYSSSHHSSSSPASSQSASERGMLNFQESSPLLPSEDVEVFFSHLDRPGVNRSQGTSERDSSGLESNKHSTLGMFQNSMHTVQASAPTYHDTGYSLHPGSNPVYVPTTRVLPMQYVSNGTGQSASSPNSPAMWMQPEYTSANTHPSVSPRFAFAPSPSSPISSPTARTDSSFNTPIPRPSGLSPYPAYMSPELSSWNYNMMQQGLRRSGPGKFL